MTQARARATTPSTKRRVPWIALGLLLVFGSSLAFAAWSRATSTRVPVLVASHDLAAGQTIGDDMVTTTEVEVGADVPTIAASDRAAVVGRVARAPIPAGPLRAPQLVTDGSAGPDGQAVVGAVLPSGAYPTAALRAGDRVQLVEAAATGDAAEARTLGDARVWALTSPDGPGLSGLFVSLLVPQDQAAATANAAARQQLRIVLVGGAS